MRKAGDSLGRGEQMLSLRTYVCDSKAVYKQCIMKVHFTFQKYIIYAQGTLWVGA